MGAKKLYLPPTQRRCPVNIANYTTFDRPVPYKSLLIYPVQVKSYLELSQVSLCLQTDKNSIEQGKYVTTQELDFLYKMSMEENSIPYVLLFDRLLALVLRDDDSFKNLEESILRYKYNSKNSAVFLIKDIEYSAEDYLQIKSIIAEQNLISLPDFNISKEVRDSLEKAREYKEKLQNRTPASLEDYIVAMSVATGWRLEDIYNMPVRKFQKAITRLDNLIHYKIYLSASMSGMVEFKNKSFIKHWLSNLDVKDKYADVSVDLDALQDKISLESAKN